MEGRVAFEGEEWIALHARDALGIELERLYRDVLVRATLARGGNIRQAVPGILSSSDQAPATAGVSAASHDIHGRLGSMSPVGLLRANRIYAIC